MSTEATIEKEKSDKKPADTSATAKSESTKTDTAEKTATKPDKKSSKSTHHSTKPKKDTQKKGGSTIASLALIISLGAIGGGYWLWQQLDIALDYSQQLATDLKANMEQTRQSLENKSQTQAEKLFMEVQGMTQRQQGVEAQLSNLLTSIGNTTRDWKISEAQYLLQIANHKLLLQHDVATAITALKLADARIRSSGEPALLPVREQISKEVTALESYSLPDITGASLKIAAISDNIPVLPLMVRVQELNKKTAVPAESGDSSNNVDNLPNALWTSLKGLITIRYNDRPVEPLLTPSQASNLNENLQLKLEQARLAILQQDSKLYQHNLARAIEWLEKYYQLQDAKVASSIKQLNELKNIKLTPELPDISRSLRDLKKIAKKTDLKLDNGKQQGGKP